jgi:hypothetical protein
MPCNFEVNPITRLGVIALFHHFLAQRAMIFLNSSQSETRIALGGHICWWNGTKWRNFIEDLT